MRDVLTTVLDCSPDENFGAGDFVDFKLFYCADFVCSVVRTGNVLIDENCSQTYQDVIRLPDDYFRISFQAAAKRRSDVRYSFYGFTLYEKRFKQTVPPDGNQTGVPPAQPANSLTWVAFAGGLIGVLGLLFLLWRKWWGLFLFILGIVLVAVGLLYKI